jgi:hypothetical protein
MRRIGRRDLLTAGSALAASRSFAQNAPVTPKSSLAKDAGRERIPDRWWESTSAMIRVAIRSWPGDPVFSLEHDKASAELDLFREQGIRAVEVFAPAKGGRSYDGLDSIDRYQLEPEAGTMDDFRRVVRLAHSKSMAIIAFDNLGYCGVDAPEFLKACDDVRAGKDSSEARRFLWSDRADAPAPGPASAATNTVFMVRPTHLPGGKPGTFYDSRRHEFWQFSERANRYYWTKWGGRDLKGNRVRLPQYNWGSESMQQEAERVIRFWMDTGIDGMIIDAVNWYVGCTWELSRRYMTGPIASYGNAFSQPEGGGGFHEDPVCWIEDGGWNSVQNYGLGIWWEKGSSILDNAIQSGDPRPIERALRDYQDRVVAAGGVLYTSEEGRNTSAARELALATVAFSGSLVSIFRSHFKPSDEMRWILQTKQSHPALHNRGYRRKLRTAADDRHYAFVRTAQDRSERVLVVLNFRPQSENVEIDLSEVSAASFEDLRSGVERKAETRLKLELPPYGYTVLQLK